MAMFTFDVPQLSLVSNSLSIRHSASKLGIIMSDRRKKPLKTRGLCHVSISGAFCGDINIDLSFARSPRASRLSVLLIRHHCSSNAPNIRHYMMVFTVEDCVARPRMPKRVAGLSPPCRRSFPVPGHLHLPRRARRPPSKSRIILPAEKGNSRIL